MVQILWISYLPKRMIKQSKEADPRYAVKEGTTQAAARAEGQTQNSTALPLCLLAPFSQTDQAQVLRPSKQLHVTPTP